VAVAARKLPGIRAAVGHDTYGARVVGPTLAAACVPAFANAEERHVRRLGKIDVMEREGFGD
jgi:ribose 5-phosphate isomerase RpiB